MALIRYPGSKEKLRSSIIDRFPLSVSRPLFRNQLGLEYREPFFGAGAIGFRFLQMLDRGARVWLNDIAPGIVALWNSVWKNPSELCEQIFRFKPSTESFYKFKEEDGSIELPEVEAGFRKLVLHQESFSGLGFMAGGPLGGKDQGNARYPVSCRWNPEGLRLTIAILHKRLQAFPNLKLTCDDFGELVHQAPRECFIYADPPYYIQGSVLYKHAMAKEDHERLASFLKGCRCDWLLSYDDHPQVRLLYSWASIEAVHITYTTATARNGNRPKNQEITITPSQVHE